jgi:hypothetical protein
MPACPPTRRRTGRAALALLLAPLSAAPALARDEPAVTCHCYRDRTYDPSRPTAADPYILATARSSLLSAAFGASKASLVEAVMTGTSPDDLWLAHWAGATTGRTAEAMLAERARQPSWAGVLRGARGLGEPFARALGEEAEARTLAGLAVDDVLVRRMGVAPATVEALRAAGVPMGERILAAALAAHLATPPVPLVARVRPGRASWGQVLQEAGLTPKDLDRVVRGLVRPPAGG